MMVSPENVNLDTTELKKLILNSSFKGYLCYKTIF